MRATPALSIAHSMSRHLCPRNVSFAGETREQAFAPREGFESTDSRATAHALLTMRVAEFQRQFADRR